MHYIINPLVPNVPFLYPLKTSEIRKVFWHFSDIIIQSTFIILKIMLKNEMILILLTT